MLVCRHALMSNKHRVKLKMMGMSALQGFDPMMTRWKIKRPQTVSQFILRGTWMSAPRFMVIHPVVVIFVWGRLKGTQTGTMGNVMGSSWPLRFILWGPWMYKHNFMAVHWSTIQAGQHYHHFVHLKRGKLQNEPQRRDGHAIYILRVERSGNSTQ